MIQSNSEAEMASPSSRAIAKCMETQRNVLLIGYHGVGKTQMVLDEAERKGLKLKYYSAATLDPWADLVGIPVPVDVDGGNGDGVRKELHFIRPADVENAEIVFFDELNRSHPKVQNAVLEMIQFRSINGVALPKLKMVWAAINPPDDVYAVTELDPVLADRFHVHLFIPARPSVAYYRDRAGIPERAAKCLVGWWRDDLNDDLRKMISPRRLEYMGVNHVHGIELRHSLPFAVKVPLRHLLRRLDDQSLLPFELTPETLVTRRKELLAEMKDNPDAMVMVTDRLLRWPGVAPRCVALFLALNAEFQAKLVRDRDIRQGLVNLARAGEGGSLELRALADRLQAMGVFRSR